MMRSGIPAREGGEEAKRTTKPQRACVAPPFGFEPPTVPSAGGLFLPLRTVARQLGSGVWDCQNGSRAHLPGVEPATGTAARVLRLAGFPPLGPDARTRS